MRLTHVRTPRLQIEQKGLINREAEPGDTDMQSDHTTSTQRGWVQLMESIR